MIVQTAIDGQMYYMGIPLTGVASTYIIPLDGGLSQNLK